MIQKFFEDKFFQIISNVTNSTAFKNHINHDAFVEIIVSCILTVIFIETIIVYAIKIRKKQKNRNVEIFFVNATKLKIIFNNQIFFELSNERKTQKILNERRDRTELFHF